MYSLAWAELRLTFSHVFRKFDMKLADSRYDAFGLRVFLVY
jgi:hypothetical protein